MGATEIIFIFVIYLLFFGAKGIPSLARTMGKAMKEFRNATGDIQREIMDGANDIRREISKNNPIEEIKKTAQEVDKSVQHNPTKHTVMSDEPDPTEEKTDSPTSTE